MRDLSPARCLAQLYIRPATDKRWLKAFRIGIRWYGQAKGRTANLDAGVGEVM